MLKGKVAVVSGGSRGIGRAVCLELADQGADIALLYAGNVQAAEETLDLLRAKGVRAEAYQCDVSDTEQVREVFKALIAAFGTVDILVNNAGITRDGLAMTMREEDFEKVLSVNLSGAFHCAKQVIPAMLRKRSGKIINISSVSGIMGNAGQCNYASAKAGMIGLAKSIAQELGSRGIRANAIAPGFIITDMTAKLSDEVKAEWAKKIPLRRGGTPEDVADVATFLASDMSSYVSGQVIQVDGGMNM